MGDKKRVLVIGDAAYPLSTTGFGVVMGMVVQKFREAQWDVVHFARGLTREPQADTGFRVYLPSAMDPNGYTYVDQICEWEQPDLIFICADPGSIGEFRRNVQVRRVKNLVYSPVEGAPLLPPWSDMLREIVLSGGRVTTYTEFGRQTIEAGFAKDDPPHTIEVLPHGVDHAPFERYEGQMLRKKIREFLGWQDKFVVINVARNAGRKNLPKWMEAVKIASGLIPNLTAYLHTVPFENYFLGGHNLLELRKYYGLDDNTLSFHRELKEGTHGIPYEGVGQGRQELGMIDLYNAADLFLSTSGGEGWNLPLSEAAACGVPCVTPMYAGGWEASRSFAYGLHVENFETHPTGLRFASLHAEDVANVMSMLYANAELREKMGEAGIAATRNMKWEPTVSRLVSLACEMV